ncbi:MAG: DedA family protein [Gammaproteobacteria bacterium]|nr:DedA family protein [Gammaproteobacteria bacterium]
MKIFSKLYDMTLRWAAHPKAPWYLGGLSFAESSFFPIPPDVMLAPMVLAKRNKAWWFAAITTIASVLGGIAGYLIGWLAFDLIEPWVMQAGYGDKLALTKDWFEQWGVWVVFIAGFAPIPYKLFTISAGVLAMSFLPFVMASLIGRGARFFLVAGIIRAGGEKMEAVLRKYIDTMGWIVIVGAVAVYVGFQVL